MFSFEDLIVGENIPNKDLLWEFIVYTEPIIKKEHVYRNLHAKNQFYIRKK